jgi:hypothetical protein
MGHLSLGVPSSLGHDCRGSCWRWRGREVAAVVAFLGGLGIEFDMPVMVERGRMGRASRLKGSAAGATL